MKCNDVTKMYYKETKKQKAPLKQDKILINSGLKKSEVVAWRKAFMREFAPQS